MCTCAPRVFAEATPLPFKLLFSGQQDLIDPWGKLHISVTPAQTISKNVPQNEIYRRAAEGKPGRSLVACFPQGDGSWVVFSTQYKSSPSPDRRKWYDIKAQWKLLRAITRDGVSFSDVETVIDTNRHMDESYRDGTQSRCG
jgi:hypothetical protein